MTRHGADGLLVFARSNILGFCGVPLEPSDRLVCGLISAEGEVACIVPEFEADLAGTMPAGHQVVTWKEHEDPYRAVQLAAARLGIERGTILLDGKTWSEACERLERAIPSATLKRDPGVIDDVRIVKTVEQVAAIRRACEDTGRIFPLIRQHLKPGISERDLAESALSALVRAGVHPIGDLIQGGPSAAVPHQPTGRRRLQTGDAVIVDFVARRDGFHGDMTRTFAVESAPEPVVAAYQAVREAQAAAIQAIRPGVSCEEVDRVARDVIERSGFGDYFVHRLGHGIGLDIHEPPYLVRGNATPLAAGMCVTVEPGIYVPAQFGIRIEDVVVVTEDGREVLAAPCRRT